MGGVDTRDRFHVHWGPAEQYAERREESRAAAVRPTGAGPRVRALRAHRPGAARRDPRQGGLPAAQRAAPSWSRRRRPTATCRSPRSSTSPTRRVPGTASCTASRRQLPAPALRAADGPRGARSAAARQCTLLGGGRVLAAFREHLGTDVGGVSPDGAVRLETHRLPRRVAAARPGSMVDGSVLPQVNARGCGDDRGRAAGDVAQGRPGLSWPSSAGARAGRRSCSRAPGRSTADAAASRPPRLRRLGGVAEAVARPRRPTAVIRHRHRRPGCAAAAAPAIPTRRQVAGCAAAERAERYVVANGFEADPGAQLDRTLMEIDPHAVVEGVALAAYAVRAARGHRRGRCAARARPSSGCAAPSPRPRSGATWAGRGWAPGGRCASRSGAADRLLRGGRGDGAAARAREPARAARPASAVSRRERGLWGQPTVVNNVETLAAVPWIVANGARRVRRDRRTGVAGHDARPARRRRAQAGYRRGAHGHDAPRAARWPRRRSSPARLKAVLVGGPTGGFLPADALDTPVLHAKLADAGALAGSGTACSPSTSARCIVDLATLLTRFLSTTRRAARRSPAGSARAGWRSWARRVASGRSRPTDRGAAGETSPRTSATARCAAWRRAPQPAASPGCDTSARSSRTTSSAAPVPPASANPSGDGAWRS